MFPPGSVYTLKRISCLPPLHDFRSFFLSQLRREGVQLPNGNALPPLFEFTELELSANPRLVSFPLPSGTAGGEGKAGRGGGGSGAAAVASRQEAGVEQA